MYTNYILCIVIVLTSFVDCHKGTEKAAETDTCDTVTSKGYPCETHTVTTEDGYILQIHRVPYGIKGNTTAKRQSVILQHGVFSDSRTWFQSDPNNSFGFILADEGYDVWVGNSRGNRYSRNHTILNPATDRAYWEFSWNEMGCYDLPSVIDYILDYNDDDKLFYVGHSQGTTEFYVLMSEKPEYASTIHAQFSLAPIAYMNGSLSPPMIKSMEVVYELAVDWSNIHEIRGTSVQQLMHFMQEQKSGDFKKFDYGKLKNYLLYGNIVPPNYIIKNITPPIYLVYSESDVLSRVANVEKFFNELPEGNKHKRLVTNKNWGHIDYTGGVGARNYVYNGVLEKMKQYV